MIDIKAIIERNLIEYSDSFILKYYNDYLHCPITFGSTTDLNREYKEVTTYLYHGKIAMIVMAYAPLQYYIDIYDENYYEFIIKEIKALFKFSPKIMETLFEIKESELLLEKECGKKDIEQLTSRISEIEDICHIIKKRKNNLNNDYKIISSMYKKIKVNNIYLSAQTNDIVIYDEYVKKDVNLGEYYIKIMFSERAMESIIIQGDSEVDGYCHPHVGRNGTPCFGNMYMDIAETVDRRDIYKILLSIYAFLSSYNKDDVFRDTNNHFLYLRRFDSDCTEINHFEECWENEPSINECFSCSDYNDCPFYTENIDDCFDNSSLENCLDCKEKDCYHKDTINKKCFNEQKYRCTCMVSCNRTMCLFHQNENNLNECRKEEFEDKYNNFCILCFFHTVCFPE